MTKRLVGRHRLTPTWAKALFWGWFAIVAIFGVVAHEVWRVPTLLLAVIIGLSYGAGLVDEDRR